LGMDIIELPDWSWKIGGYSSHLRAKVSLAWTKAKETLASGSFKRVLVIDDGGFVIGATPENLGVPVCGIEQTTSGLAAAAKARFL